MHGLGLSTRLQELDLPEGGALVARILAFNVGVEIGQLIALFVLVGAGLLAVRVAPTLAYARRHLAGGLVAFGLLTALALSFLAVRNEASASDTTADARAASCTQQPFTPPPPSLSGGHPDRAFYPPGESPPRADLEHVMGDGFIVVAYRNTVPEDERQALADWTEDVRFGVVVVPATANAPFALEALTAGRRLTCRRVSIDALAAFRDGSLG